MTDKKTTTKGKPTIYTVVETEIKKMFNTDVVPKSWKIALNEMLALSVIYEGKHIAENALTAVSQINRMIDNFGMKAIETDKEELSKIIEDITDLIAEGMKKEIEKRQNEQKEAIKNG